MMNDQILFKMFKIYCFSTHIYRFTLEDIDLSTGVVWIIVIFILLNLFLKRQLLGTSALPLWGLCLSFIKILYVQNGKWGKL